MKKIFIIGVLLIETLFSTEAGLNLEEAIKIVKANNLEIKIAKLSEQEMLSDLEMASGHHLGKLDFIQNIMRTDDAGNHFGFRLSSREANFNNFGFDEFLGQMGELQSNPDSSQALLETIPNNLNYPEITNYFQSKLVYQLPIYSGGVITSYQKIAETMQKISTLDKKSIIQEKIYQTKKSFFDMSLLNATIRHLSIILNNIDTLENMANSMKAEGYGKDIDLLEIQARKTSVERLVSQMESKQKLLYHYISFLLNKKVTHIETKCSIVPMPDISVKMVLEENIDIKKAKNGLKIFEEMINISTAKYLPEVGAFAEIQTSDDSFLEDANNHKSFTVGVKLTWNIFNGGIDSADLEKKKVQKLKTINQIELAKVGISLKYNQIITEIENYKDELKSLEKEFELSNEIYKNYEECYRENLKSMNDIVMQQSNQIQKIMELLKVKNKINERIFALEKLFNKKEGK